MRLQEAEGCSSSAGSLDSLTLCSHRFAEFKYVGRVPFSSADLRSQLFTLPSFKTIIQVYYNVDVLENWPSFPSLFAQLPEGFVT